MFLRIWFAHTLPLPKEARHAASQSGEQRYRLLLERVGEQFTEGKRFIDDLPPLARELEREAARAASARSQAGGSLTPAGDSDTSTAAASTDAGLHREPSMPSGIGGAPKRAGGSS
jgi:hypothetical protein